MPCYKKSSISNKYINNSTLISKIVLPASISIAFSAFKLLKLMPNVIAAYLVIWKN